MRTIEVSAASLFQAGRWRVEIFTDDNSENITSRWPHVRLSELADESNAAMAPEDFPADEFCYVGLENVEPVTGDPVDLRMRPKHEIKSRSKVFAADYVLYGRLRSYLRKVFLAADKFSAGLCSTEFIVLKPNRAKILPVVLRALLASDEIAKQLARLQSGAALPRVSPRDFFRTTLPLPPLEVQHKMVEQLTKLYTERRKLKARLDSIPEEFDAIVSEHALGS